MLIRRFFVTGFLIGITLPFTTKPAIAGSNGAFLIGRGELLLLQATLERSSERRYRFAGSAGSDRFRLQKLRAQWTYHLGEGGPTLVVAALGGRKGTPKLAHVRIAWHF